MSDQARELPDQPSLRYLKLEAKRRLAAGEFATLHDAQLAIAREHGRSSWTTLKQQIESHPAGSETGSHALDQVRWVIARFVDSDQDGWAAPNEAELLEHFTEHFLTVIPAGRIVAMLSSQAAAFQGELSVTDARANRLQAGLPGFQVQAATEPEPPHRLTGLGLFPGGERITDPRVAAGTSRTDGDVPAAAREIADSSATELALPALVLAGTVPAGGGPGDPAGAEWVLARGWADLDAERPLRPDHQFPAFSITKLVTAVAVLRLVADGAVQLDAPANDYLRTVRLADPEATVRELLTHTAGADSPGPDELFARQVPALVSVTGPVVGRRGPRGPFAYSNGGYALLGQLIADVYGQPYDQAAGQLVLGPLGMTDSWFPVRWPNTPDSPKTPDAVTGYGVTEQAFRVITTICTLPAAGGLWSTAADLIRFARDWPGLLPADLAAEAVRPQASWPDGEVQMGLGWVVNQAKGLTGHTGGGRGGSTSLIVTDGGRIHLALTNRLIPIEPVNKMVLETVSFKGPAGGPSSPSGAR
jgi:CubicO group peptidase (beta-lactamase class C family)